MTQNINDYRIPRNFFLKDKPDIRCISPILPDGHNQEQEYIGWSIVNSHSRNPITKARFVSREEYKIIINNVAEGFMDTKDIYDPESPLNYRGNEGVLVVVYNGKIGGFPICKVEPPFEDSKRLEEKLEPRIPLSSVSQKLSAKTKSNQIKK